MNKPTKIIAAAGTIAQAGGIRAGLAYADSPTDSPTASLAVSVEPSLAAITRTRIRERK